MLESGLICRSLKLKKSHLHYTRGITPKRVTSDLVHRRCIAPGQHSSEETLQRWRAVGDTTSDLAISGIEHQKPRMVCHINTTPTGSWNMRLSVSINDCKEIADTSGKFGSPFFDYCVVITLCYNESKTRHFHSIFNSLVLRNVIFNVI